MNQIIMHCNKYACIITKFI
jgi:hypothetical protein